MVMVPDVVATALVNAVVGQMHTLVTDTLHTLAELDSGKPAVTSQTQQ